MSKAKLEFDLNDLDDRLEYERVVKSTDMSFLLFDVVYNYKKNLYWEFEKLEEKGETPSVYDGIDAVLDKIVSEMNEKGIILDKLIV